MDNLRKRLGNRIRARRNAIKLNQDDLAKRAKTSQVTIWKIENGKVATNLDLLEKIAQALDLTPSELISDTAPPRHQLNDCLEVAGRWMAGETGINPDHLAHVPIDILNMIQNASEQDWADVRKDFASRGIGAEKAHMARSLKEEKKRKS